MELDGKSSCVYEPEPWSREMMYYTCNVGPLEPPCPNSRSDQEGHRNWHSHWLSENNLYVELQKHTYSLMLQKQKFHRVEPGILLVRGGTFRFILCRMSYINRHIKSIGRRCTTLIACSKAAINLSCEWPVCDSSHVHKITSGLKVKYCVRLHGRLEIF